MNTKREIIGFINATKGACLSNSNTSYSKINKSKEVWWFNVRTHKFNEEVHLLLKADKKVIWIRLPKGFVSKLNKSFKIREDKDAVDLEISANTNSQYLKDVKSGGTHFDFKPYAKEVIAF